MTFIINSFILVALGMGLFMDFLELFDGIVGIYLGGGQVLVPEQLLDSHEAGAFVQQMRGEGVAQHVRALLLEGSDAFEKMVHLIIYIRGRHLLPFVVEQETVGLVGKGGVAYDLVLVNHAYHLL